MGSSTGLLDTRLPGLTGGLTGTSGENGWYVSDVILSATASDPAPGSGLASVSYSLDGSGWFSFPGSLSLADGVHTVVLVARDMAGNANTTTQTVQVDSQPPQVSGTLGGTIVNGWYTQAARFTATATDPDPGSGLGDVFVSLDDAAWQAYTSPLTIGDGVHNLRLAADDLAGNISAEQAFDFRVDAAPWPESSLSGQHLPPAPPQLPAHINHRSGEPGQGPSNEAGGAGNEWVHGPLPQQNCP
jgi:hypothetical protein